MYVEVNEGEDGLRVEGLGGARGGGEYVRDDEGVDGRAAVGGWRQGGR